MDASVDARQQAGEIFARPAALDGPPHIDVPVLRFGRPRLGLLEATVRACLLAQAAWEGRMQLFPVVRVDGTRVPADMCRGAGGAPRC